MSRSAAAALLHRVSSGSADGSHRYCWSGGRPPWWWGFAIDLFPYRRRPVGRPVGRRWGCRYAGWRFRRNRFRVPPQRRRGQV